MKLNKKRQEIDEVDVEISKLLNKRFLIIQEIKKIKEQSNIDILDEAREKEVIHKNKKYIKEDFYIQFEQIYYAIMAASKDIQKK